MDNGAIPTDINDINAEINELLAVTPSSSERGRLFWLIKAAIDHGRANPPTTGQAPFFLGSFTMLADDATNAQVATNGGAAVTSSSRSTLRLSYISAAGIRSTKALDSLAQANQTWRIGIYNPTTDFSQQLTATFTGTVVATGGLNTFTLNEDLSTSFSVGTTFEVFALPESGGGSGGSAFNGVFDLGSYTWQNNFNDETDNGNISFNDGYIQIRSDNTAGDNFQSLLQNGVSDGWRLRITASGNATTVELNNVDYETSDDYFFANLPTDTGLASITNGTTVTVQLLLPIGRPFKNFGQLLQANYSVSSVTSTSGTPSEGEILLNNATASSVTSIRAHYSLSNIPLRAKLTRLTTSDTIGIVNNDQVQYYSITNVNNNQVGEYVTLTVAAVTGDFLGSIATSDRLALVKI